MPKEKKKRNEASIDERTKLRGKIPEPKVRLEFVKYIATHLQQQISLADRKAAWTFSVLAVGTGALLTRVTKIDWTTVDVLRTTSLLVIAAFILIIAFIQVVRVVYPRLIKGSKEGLTYFGDIIENEEGRYVKKGTKLTEEEIVKSLYEESYNLAKIASKKFRQLLYGIILTAMALISTIILLLLI